MAFKGQDGLHRLSEEDETVLECDAVQYFVLNYCGVVLRCTSVELGERVQAFGAELGLRGERVEWSEVK